VSPSCLLATSNYLGMALVPEGFSRANVHGIQNCPDAVVEVRLIFDPAEETSHAEPKNDQDKYRYAHVDCQNKRGG